MNLQDLPPYLLCGYCDTRHFLCINRCVDGSWAIGYVNFDDGSTIGGLGINHCESVREACIRMSAAINRWERRNNGQVEAY